MYIKIYHVSIISCKINFFNDENDKKKYLRFVTIFSTTIKIIFNKSVACIYIYIYM